MNKIVRIVRRSYRLLFPEYDFTKIGHIGKGCKIASGSTLVMENLYLDDYVILQDHLNFISAKGKLYVGKYSVISAGCIIVPGEHRLKIGMPFYINAKYNLEDREHDIIIKEDCWIGTGSILLPGIKIGRGAIVGAGSVVTKDVIPYSVVAGNPAKIIAMRMNADDVPEHEKLYPEHLRMSKQEISEIFKDKEHIRVIADNNISSENLEILNTLLNSFDK